MFSAVYTRLAGHEHLKSLLSLCHSWSSTGMTDINGANLAFAQFLRIGSQVLTFDCAFTH